MSLAQPSLTSGKLCNSKCFSQNIRRPCRHSSVACSVPSPKGSLDSHSPQTQAIAGQNNQNDGQDLSRRALLGGAVAGLCLISSNFNPASAIQGLTAGRIPGVSRDPDDEGYYTYTRPEGKSGGHGVGWSEIPRYRFKIPEGWEERPVSIADLGGTEIDLRYGNRDQGSLEVVVAPVLRFVDVGYNADVRIEELGPPGKIISGFAPELFGAPLGEDDVIKESVEKKDGLTYYSWELSKNRLVAATAVKNRCFIIAISANGRQWRKAADTLRHVQQSFRVPASGMTF